MFRGLSLIRSLACPVVLLVVVWSITLLAVGIGPIHYPQQPSLAVLGAVMAGVTLFGLGQFFGVRLARMLFDRISATSPTSDRLLDRLVVGAAVLGISGIALIAVEKYVLGEYSNAVFAAFLRCAPGFVDAIDYSRTPFIYVGYLIFSFGYLSLALFLLRGEELRGWPAYLAQASIVVPIGYSLVYSGRMPTLLMVVLVVGIGLVRIVQGRKAIPSGHHLLLKAFLVTAAFGIYSSWIWGSRWDFCAQIQPVVAELQKQFSDGRTARISTGEISKLVDQALSVHRAKIAADRATDAADQAKFAAEQVRAAVDRMQAAVSAQVKTAADEVRTASDQASVAAERAKMAANRARAALSIDPPQPGGAYRQIIFVMEQSWKSPPREYLSRLMETGWLPPRAALILIGNYFYLTHGVMIVDRISQNVESLEPPFWGIYQIGVLGPILRAFFPDDDALDRMQDRLEKTSIYGFFPSVWGAAYLDFGVLGGALYIIVWGLLGGWSYEATKRTNWLTPPLLLSFILATILLSTIQGPLGAANSALVFGTLVFGGLLADLAGIRRERKTS